MVDKIKSTKNVFYIMKGEYDESDKFYLLEVSPFFDGNILIDVGRTPISLTYNEARALATKILDWCDSKETTDCRGE